MNYDKARATLLKESRQLGGDDLEKRVHKLLSDADAVFSTLWDAGCPPSHVVGHLLRWWEVKEKRVVRPPTKAERNLPRRMIQLLESEGGRSYLHGIHLVPRKLPDGERPKSLLEETIELLYWLHSSMRRETGSARMEHTYAGVRIRRLKAKARDEAFLHVLMWVQGTIQAYLPNNKRVRYHAWRILRAAGWSGDGREIDWRKRKDVDGAWSAERSDFVAAVKAAHARSSQSNSITPLVRARTKPASYWGAAGLFFRPPVG